MVLCVYLRFNCVSQSEPAHRQQSDSSRVQPPDVGGWKSWKRDSISGWSPLALLRRARAHLMGWTTCARPPPCSLTRLCLLHHFLLASVPAVDGHFSELLSRQRWWTPSSASADGHSWSSRTEEAQRDTSVDQCWRHQEAPVSPPPPQSPFHPGFKINYLLSQK